MAKGGKTTQETLASEPEHQKHMFLFSRLDGDLAQTTEELRKHDYMINELFVQKEQAGAGKTCKVVCDETTGYFWDWNLQERRHACWRGSNSNAALSVV